MMPEHATTLLQLLVDRSLDSVDGDPHLETEQVRALRDLIVDATPASAPALIATALVWAHQQEDRIAEEAARHAQRAAREASPLSADELLGMIRRGEVPPFGLQGSEARSLWLVPVAEREAAIREGEAVRERRDLRTWGWDRLPGGAGLGPWSGMLHQVCRDGSGVFYSPQHAMR